MPVGSYPTELTPQTATGASHLRGQNLEGRQACRPSGRAADEVRAGDESQNGKADRRDDSKQRPGESRLGDQVIIGVRQQVVVDSKKLTFIAYALCTMFFALCSTVEGQQQAKLPKIGWLGAGPASFQAAQASYSCESCVDSAISTARM